MKPIRVLVVDDNETFINAVDFYLSTEPRLEFAGRAYSGAEALEQVLALQPDLVLMDYAMPEMDGIEATRQIKAVRDAPLIFLLTMYADLPGYGAAAVNAGADGFFSKREPFEKIISKICAMFADLNKDTPITGLLSTAA